MYGAFVCGASWRQEEGVGCPEAGVTDGCEPSEVGDGTQLRASGRAAILDHWAISPDQKTSFLRSYFKKINK